MDWFSMKQCVQTVFSLKLFVFSMETLLWFPGIFYQDIWHRRKRGSLIWQSFGSTNLRNRLWHCAKCFWSSFIKLIGWFGNGPIDGLIRLADRGSVQCWAHHPWSDSIHTAASNQWKPPSHVGHASCLWRSPVKGENGQSVRMINLCKVFSLISKAGKL